MIHALPPAIVAGELVRLQTRQHVVALTFDGGGNADGAKAVLALLRRERVTGTFFLTGHFVKTYPTLSTTSTCGVFRRRLQHVKSRRRER